MVWDDAKREAARQRMKYAQEVRRAKIEQRRLAQSSVAVVESPSIQADADLKPDLVLTIRRLRVGSFTGLWELCRVEPDGKLTVITDANTKSIVINLVRNEIVKCGQ